MSALTPQDRRQVTLTATAIGMLAGVVAGGVATLSFGAYGLLVAIAAAMIRAGYEVWKLRRREL